MGSNCRRCGYILMESNAPCPNCVRVYQMALQIGSQCTPDTAPIPCYRCGHMLRPEDALCAGCGEKFHDTSAGLTKAQFRKKTAHLKSTNPLDEAERKNNIGLCFLFGIPFLLVGFGLGNGLIILIGAIPLIIAARLINEVYGG